MGMLKVFQTVELEAIVFQWEILKSMENSARVICIKFYPHSSYFLHALRHRVKQN